MERSPCSASYAFVSQKIKDSMVFLWNSTAGLVVSFTGRRLDTLSLEQSFCTQSSLGVTEEIEYQ